MGTGNLGFGHKAGRKGGGYGYLWLARAEISEGVNLEFMLRRSVFPAPQFTPRAPDAELLIYLSESPFLPLPPLIITICRV